MKQKTKHQRKTLQWPIDNLLSLETASLIKELGYKWGINEINQLRKLLYLMITINHNMGIVGNFQPSTCACCRKFQQHSLRPSWYADTWTYNKPYRRVKIKKPKNKRQ